MVILGTVLGIVLLWHHWRKIHYLPLFLRVTFSLSYYISLAMKHLVELELLNFC